MDIKDRVVLITGGKRIGQVVALELARRGADIATAYRGSRAEAIQADVSHEDQCRALVEETLARLGRLDVLINMASIYRPRPLMTMTANEWDEDLNVNLRAAFIASQAAARHMQAGGGRIVNFSDWLAASGRPAYKDFVAYYVAKAGVKALTEALALELAPKILVNAIAPGPILPPPDLTPEENAEVARATPLGRWGGETEIAKAVLTLVESDFITGETIRVDGGRHLR